MALDAIVGTLAARHGTRQQTIKGRLLLVGWGAVQRAGTASVVEQSDETSIAK